MSKPLGQRAAAEVSTVDDVVSLVRARGGRASSSRRAVLEVLFEARAHLTAEEVTEAVQRRLPDVRMSTVYRNLEALQQLGVIVHSHLGHGSATYQLAATAHTHLVCEVCGISIDTPDQLFARLARKTKTEFGFTINPHHFAILGRCAACG